MLTFTTAHSINDLQQILVLQSKNLPQNLDQGRMTPDGFVTLQHSYDLLKGMNYPHPHIIAKEADKVVGYTLVMQRYWKDEIPLLCPMFNKIDAHRYQGRLLQECNYFVMGQVCVADSHRGQGIFRSLYQKLKAEYDHHFEFCITEISSKNIRSLNAHHAVGFQTIFSYPAEDGLQDWHVVLWDWA